MSSQLISVRFNNNLWCLSILTATGKQLIYVSHLSLLIFGLIMSIVSIGLYYINISMEYLYTMMGIIISSGVLPGVLTFLWNRQSKLAVCLSPPLDLIYSLIS